MPTRHSTKCPYNVTCVNTQAHFIPDPGSVKLVRIPLFIKRDGLENSKIRPVQRHKHVITEIRAMVAVLPTNL